MSVFAIMPTPESTHPRMLVRGPAQSPDIDEIALEAEIRSNLMDVLCLSRNDTLS
jgi:hypothetical protein